MGVFAKYRKFYLEPERISPENARQNRVSAALKKELEQQQRYERLSPVTKSILDDTRRVSNDRLRFGQKEALIASALSKFKETDLADPALRMAYRELRAQQGGQQKVKASGSDKRSFNPTGKDFASTIYGYNASLRFKNLNADKWLPVFKTVGAVVPCIERIVRREVMFAKKKAGHGYRKPKRRTWASGIPC